jgi:mono/diheme cytochrome c family protein
MKCAQAALSFLMLTAFVAAIGDAEGAEVGKLDYLRLCASCHGITGKGDGPVGKYLKTPPSDLTALSKRHGGVFPADSVRDAIAGVKQVGEHGTREMPVWGRAMRLAPAIAGANIKRIVSFVATLQRQ